MFHWSWLSLGLFLACLGSFSWGMRKFFHKPSGDSGGMRLVRVCSGLFTALNIAAILATPDVPLRQTVTAGLMYSASLALFFWALRTNSQRALSAVFSPDTPQHLVMRGPYQLVRHPFYCSYLLTWTAGFVATGRWWLLPTVVVMAIIYYRASEMEEQKFAASPLAAEYREYRERTGRFLPNPFSWLKSRRKEPDEASLA